MGTTRPTSRFCEGCERSNLNFKIVSEAIQDQLNHLLSGHRYRAIRVKSLTLDERMSDNSIL